MQIGKLIEVRPQELDTFETFIGQIIDIYEEEDGQVPITTFTVQNVKDGSIKNVDASQCFEFFIGDSVDTIHYLKK